MGDVEVLRFVEGSPLRTARWEDVAALVPNAGRTLARLSEKGALTRIARGVYVAPPEGADGRTWKPPLEAAALALGTARHGERNVVLAGIGAARYWGAIPRAISQTMVAVAVRGRHPVFLDTGGSVTFVHRDLHRMDATLEATALGDALVATPAQTVYDLIGAGRTGIAGEDHAAEGIRNLIPRVSKVELAEIAGRALRVPARVTRMLDEWDRDD